MAGKTSFSELFKRCLQVGDDKAWVAIVAYLQPLVAGVTARSAMRWGPVTPELVEDLSQEVFLKLFVNRGAIFDRVKGRPEEAMLAFLRVMVGNLVHDHFRSEHSAKRKPAAGFLTTELFDEILGDTRAMDAIERDLLLDEVDRILRQKLSGQTVERDMQIFWFHHRAGMTAKAIAKIGAIGLTEKGVESALFRLGVIIKEELATAKGIAARDSFE